MSETGKTIESWVFNRESLDKSLNEWMQLQIDAYPHQEELIKTTVLAMQDFLSSEIVIKNKMTM